MMVVWVISPVNNTWTCGPNLHTKEGASSNGKKNQAATLLLTLWAITFSYMKIWSSQRVGTTNNGIIDTDQTRADRANMFERFMEDTKQTKHERAFDVTTLIY